jgi:hypothetical protein
MLPAALALVAAAPLLPSPYDAHGWGLRVHNLSVSGPYLLGEHIGQIRFDVTLLNFSAETREHDPLTVARDTRDLRLTLFQPDGKRFSKYGFSAQRDPFTQPRRLRGGEFSSLDFDFKAFGYGLIAFGQVGRHRLEPSMKIGGKVVMAPPVEFDVVAVPPSAVLASHPVRLEGRAATESAQPVVQQVPVGNRTLLIYRGHYDPAKPGGGPYSTKRLAELPGKCEMTVEGAYGAGKPLTITYKAAPDARPTRLVINSVSGSPWTEEDERHLQERLSRVAPMPRPVGP